MPAGSKPDSVHVCDLMALVRLDGKPGFVVEDFTDASSFEVFDTAEPTAAVAAGLVPLGRPAAWRRVLERLPAEALQQIVADWHSPHDDRGILQALQCPPTNAGPGCLNETTSADLIGSRKRREGWLRCTPALWISNGTGRGRTNKNAAKLGWCWWNNRHTWLGIAHAARRTGSPTTVRPLGFQVRLTNPLQTRGLP